LPNRAAGVLDPRPQGLLATLLGEKGDLGKLDAGMECILGEGEVELQRVCPCQE